ncbi:MAG: response regulator [Candidatus Competibacteraceae bacterium]|nr:response regulator [Candidatus Competibacteraceae bacterium]
MNEKRLLIVDDEPAFGEFVRQVALSLDYQVMVTTDGKAFQECYANFQPTTIMLDMVMPGMDGNELLLWLLQQGYASDLVITTGYNPDYASDAKTLAEFNGLRAVTTLVKPFSLARLRTVLGRREP